MDGYAVHSGDVATGSATLRVIGLQTAGQVTATEVTAGTALQIMTGAPCRAELIVWYALVIDAAMKNGSSLQGVLSRQKPT